MSIRKFCLCLGVCAWAVASFGEETIPRTPTNTPAITNILAFYLVADSVPDASIVNGTATPLGLKLKAEPILADADFIAWNVTNHTFVITPNAAKKFAGSVAFGDVIPFVLMAGGEPIYLGLFGTRVSSASAAVPVILTDCVFMDCFVGMTNATTNVTLTIDRGYPPPDGFGVGVDRRGDQRIAVAVKKLLGTGRH